MWPGCGEFGLDLALAWHAGQDRVVCCLARIAFANHEGGFRGLHLERVCHEIRMDAFVSFWICVVFPSVALMANNCDRGINGKGAHR